MTAGRRAKSRSPESFRERTYRGLIDPGRLVSYEVAIKETDLHLLTTRNLAPEGRDLALQARSQLERYIASDPRFLAALAPLPPDPLAPPVVKEMLAAGQQTGVGPMAAVAGTIAEYVGRGLLAHGAEEVVVENGGDIFLHRRAACTVGIFAGTSKLSNRVGIRIPLPQMPTGVCTSSGTVGHSLSFGKADAVTVVAASTALADAAATALGNRVQQASDISQALEFAKSILGLRGVVIVVGEQLGAWGEVELVQIAPN